MSFLMNDFKNNLIRRKLFFINERGFHSCFISLGSEINIYDKFSKRRYTIFFNDH